MYMQSMERIDTALTAEKIVKLMRVHQYAKNTLLFLPWILSHQYNNLIAIENLFLAFISFCLLASSAYIINDLLDLSSDRQHKTKQYRILASGALLPTCGITIAVVSFIVAWVIAIPLPLFFKYIMAFYFLTTMLYSFWLKKKLLLDVIILSSLYTIRVLAGMSLLRSGYSHWVLLFSLFFFTSLAFLKRYIELFSHKDQSQTLNGRSYMVFHSQFIQIFGICSGYLSILIIALYLNSQKATTLYHYPGVLYAACPIFVYWISRAWLIAASGNMHDDPVVFALNDKVTYIVVFLLLLIGLIATY